MNVVHLLPGAVNEMIASVSDTRCITKADRYGMMAAILDESITEEERGCVDRIIRYIVKGRIKITDDFSIIL
jgi:hypothetical protein